ENDHVEIYRRSGLARREHACCDEDDPSHEAGFEDRDDSGRSQPDDSERHQADYHGLRPVDVRGRPLLGDEEEVGSVIPATSKALVREDEQRVTYPEGDLAERGVDPW